MSVILRIEDLARFLMWACAKKGYRLEDLEDITDDQALALADEWYEMTHGED